MNHPLLAILNTLWQSAAIAAGVWLVLRLARGTNAATRHALWWTVLAVVVLLPAVPSRRSQDPAPVPAPIIRSHDSEAFAIPVGPRQPVAPDPRPRGVELPSGDWPSIVLSLWALVCLLQSARIGWSYRRLRILKRDARPAGGALLNNFDAWVQACGIRRPVRLLISTRIASPIAVGFRRPAILLPEPLLAEFRETELDHVLLHELAHIARRDDWTNLAARLAGGLFAFHPVALWLVRQIDRERELSCDDWVVSMTGAPRPYASCLTRLFELCHPRNRLVLASGMASRASHLGERVERLLHARQWVAKTSFVKLGFASAALIAAGLAFSQTPRLLAIAQDRQVAPDPPEAAPGPESLGASEAPEAPQPRVATKGGFLAGLVAAGYGDLSVDEIINLKNSGLDAAYIAEMAQAGWGRLDAKTLIDLHNSGVPPEFARAIRQAGLRNPSLRDVVHLKQNGVDPDALRRIHELGFGPFDAAEASELHNNGVRFELIQAFKDAGWKELSAKDLVEAQRNGIHAGSLREARQFGSSITLKQIIRLKQAGVI